MPQTGIDFTRATQVTPEIEAQIKDLFDYHAWNDDQKRAGIVVRRFLSEAVKAIIDVVPPGPDRTSAIRKIREAGMSANAAITHEGRY